jgi:hypothetical protein
LYPSIIIEYGYMSRAVRDVEKYREIRDTRLEYKKAKNPMQAPLKIVLNSCYGTFKDQYNPLYDPRQSNNVCITGQLLLLDLIEKLEPYVQIIQSNTDGIFMLLQREEDIDIVKNVAAEWEARTRLTLEWDRYTKIVQKDVNNFIMVAEDGSYKSKGAYLKELSPIDSDLLISNKALIEYFVHGTPIEETVRGSRNLSDFQKIVKVTSLYSHALLGDQRLKEKVLRVFASTDENAPGVSKVKIVDGEEKIEKIANTPEHCFLYNDDINGVGVPINLDLDYYINLVNMRLNDFYSSERRNAVKPKSEIKGINEDLYNMLFDLDFEAFPTFVDLLIYLKDEVKANKTVVRILIELGYLSSFGMGKKLLRIWECFYDEVKYSSAQSEKTREKKLTVLRELEDSEGGVDFSELEKLQFRKKYLGHYVTNDPADRFKVYVEEIYPAKRKKDGKQFGKSIVATSIGSGKTSRYTIFNKTLREYGDVAAGQILKMPGKSGYTTDGRFFNMVCYKHL